MERLRILLADDHPVVRQGLKTFFATQPDLEVVAEAATGAEAVARATELRPDVALLDLVMPDGGGIEAAAQIREASPATKVIVLTSYAEDENVIPALKAGAAGYLLKDVEPQELADGVRRVHRGEALLHPAVAARVLREVVEPQADRDVLTPREVDVLRLLGRGLANKRIALELGIAERTVKTHVSSILAKLGVTDRTQAALYAVREHLADH
ncbi:MAG: response regulator transcription factor [Actinobacteria bacterium]|nr:MAG: response regulator transcription factor [Actinomycetota bacterium]